MLDLRTQEAVSIRRFVESCSSRFRGRVLDLGCGQQPYRDIVEAAGGEYLGLDYPALPGHVAPPEFAHGVQPRIYTGPASELHRDWDAVLCTQVLQYVQDPHTLLRFIYTRLLRADGVLALTYPTNWPEVEEADLHRFTKAGMTGLLVDSGFVIERHERRAQVTVADGQVFALGYGVVARA